MDKPWLREIGAKLSEKARQKARDVLGSVEYDDLAETAYEVGEYGIEAVVEKDPETLWTAGYLSGIAAVLETSETNVLEILGFVDD